jgi:hypothetical protein
MKTLPVRDRLLWITLAIQRNLLWITLGIVAAYAIVVNGVSFQVLALDEEALKKAMPQ